MEPLALLGIVGAIGVACFTQVPKIWRRHCPQCQRRSLANFGQDRSGDGMWFRHFYCVRCKLHLASLAPDEYIAMSEWDRGVRHATPWARVRE